MNSNSNNIIIPIKSNTQKALSMKSKNNFILKKNENSYINEHVVKSLGRFFIPLSYGDRFIARRYPKIIDSETTVMQTSNSYSQRQGTTRTVSFDILDLRTDKSYWRLDKFRNIFIDLFDFNFNQRLLQFHDHLQDKAPYYTRYNNIDWPCIPRAVPSAFVESTHDLPRFNATTSTNLFAWSHMGIIAAAFFNELVLWNPPSEDTVCFLMRNITSLGFSSDGKYLATGSDIPTAESQGQIRSESILKLWLVDHNKLLMISGLLVVGAGKLNSIEWLPKKLPHQSYIIVGCEVGSVIIFKYSNKILKMIDNITMHDASVINLKFSPDCVYVASVDELGIIVVWKWSNGGLTANFKWRSDDQHTYFDWHPWSPGLLVVAEECGAIAVVQVVGKRILSSYQRHDAKCKINAISFNKLSAELVISYTFVEKNGKTVYELVVLSSLHNIVDRVRNHNRAVRLLCWGPNQTTLATPGDDEALTIWNFFAIFHRSMRKRLDELESANKSKLKWNLVNRLKYVPEIR